MIGNKIRQRRIELGMTQEELAHRLGYKTKSAVNKIEMGINDVSQSKLLRIADALDCSPTYLLDIETFDESASYDRISLYADLLSKLPPDRLDSALKYIDFLSQKNEDNK